MQSPQTFGSMSALGETFRTARESQGLSLSDASDRLHIRSAYLAAIEAEDWQVIGPAVYVRGFLRNYAKFLGLDGDAAVAQFSAGPAGQQATAPITPTRTEQSRGVPPDPGLAKRAARAPVERPRSGPSPWAVILAIVAVGLVVFAGYEYFEYRRSVATDVKAGVPAADVAQPPTQAVAAAAATPELPAPVKNGVGSNGLAVRLKDSSWLRVTVDGKVAMEGMFPAGTMRSFTGRSAVVRVGNAGGVVIAVNGKDLGPMGGPGDVAERAFHI